MDADRDIESSVSGDLDTVGSPLVKELGELFARHGFDGGFVFSAFALDGDRWRFDSGAVIDSEKVPEDERHHVIGEALVMASLAVQDMMGDGDA